MKREKKERVSRNKFYHKYLQLINVILPEPLTTKEIEILSAFMELEGDLIEEDRFGTQCRKYIRDKFKFKSYSNLDNYIKYMKQKGVLLRDEDTGKLIINKRIEIPKDTKDIELVFKFELEDG